MNVAPAQQQQVAPEHARSDALRWRCALHALHAGQQPTGVHHANSPKSVQVKLHAVQRIAVQRSASQYSAAHRTLMAEPAGMRTMPSASSSVMCAPAAPRSDTHHPPSLLAAPRQPSRVPSIAAATCTDPNYTLSGSGAEGSPSMDSGSCWTRTARATLLTDALLSPSTRALRWRLVHSMQTSATTGASEGSYAPSQRPAAPRSRAGARQSPAGRAQVDPQ